MQARVYAWYLIGLFFLACSGNATTGPQDTAKPDEDVVEDKVEDLEPEIDLVPDDEVEPPQCFDKDNDGAFAGPGCENPTDCDDDNDKVYEGAPELCGDRIDNNCNNVIDEDCPCGFGELRLCSSAGSPESLTPDMPCRAGYQRCVDGVWESSCVGEVGPQPESCNGIDDNCDGRVDEGLLNALGECDTGQVIPDEYCGPTDEGNGLDDNGNGEMDEGCSSCVLGGMPRLDQPCYSGIPSTLGVGECRSGLRDCQMDGAWGACEGEVTPAQEICGDALDNDCDGEVDETCGGCVPDGEERCDGRDNDCNGLIDEGVRNACGGCGPVASIEMCNGIDDDCDGQVDEDCPCTEGATQACYPGPTEAKGKGICLQGEQSCVNGQWSACEGYVLPAIELCGAEGRGNTLDDDCDGATDENCGCAEGSIRPCGVSAGICEYGTQTCSNGDWSDCSGGVGPQDEGCDGLDNDCDGVVDEGLLNACGTCGESCYQAQLDPAGQGSSDPNLVSIDGSDPNNPTGEPGLTLSSAAIIPPFLWAANQDYDSVSKFNVETHEEVGRYWAGDNVSRTAVDLDGNMWVGGRDDGRVTKVAWKLESCIDRNGNGTIETSYRDGSGNVIQVNSAANPYADECVIYSEVMNPPCTSVRGVSAAPNGKMWIGFSSCQGGVQSIDPVTLEVGPYYPPVNIPLWVPDSNGVYYETSTLVSGGLVYGQVVDSEGQLYYSSYARNYLPRFDTYSEQWIAVYRRDGQCSYGIAVDGRNRVFTGGYPACSGVTMWDPAQRKMYTFGVPTTVGPTPGETSAVALIPNAGPIGPGHMFTTGVGVEPATGDVWCSFYPIGYNGRLHLDENNYANSQWTFIATSRDLTTNAYLPGVGPDLRGIGFDGHGYAWTLGLGSDRLWKIDPATNARSADLPNGQPIGPGTHYTYSDFTGSTTLSFTAPRGFWGYTFSAEYPNTQVDGIGLKAFAPPVTSIGVRVRVVDGAGQGVSPWYPAEQNGSPQYFEYPTGELEHIFELAPFGGPLFGQHFEVQLRLSTTVRTMRPIVNQLWLEWQRP
ncbi:MAG: MopE-related protein [Myxococcota bacterium]|jgi:streptogramin lyase|nr:MopE-related protein [Myxococcota bacterium]